MLRETPYLILTGKLIIVCRDYFAEFYHVIVGQRAIIFAASITKLVNFDEWLWAISK